ncbi:hypothetical protein BH18ACT8_BH18ACT8_16330 [soil metagenome]
MRSCCNLRRYTVTYRDGRRVQVDAEGMWPTTPTCVEFLVTVAVVGIPRHVVAQRVMLVELASVEREDGAVWRGKEESDSGQPFPVLQRVGMLMTDDAAFRAFVVARR